MSRSFGRAAAAAARAVTMPLNKWRRAMADAYAAQVLTPTWEVQTSAGRLVFTGPSGRALHDAHGFNRDEPETVAWIEQLPTDALLWDIGANVGTYAMLAARRGIRVIAFEPSAATLAVLVRNLELNKLGDKVAAYGVALAEFTKLDMLYMASDHTDPGHAMHAFGERDTVLGVIEGGFQQAAIGFRGDDFIAQFNAPAPTHVKLDVDSIEAAILRGLHTTLRTSVRELMVEIYDTALPAQAQEIRALLGDAGFAEKPTGYPNGRNRLFVRGGA